MKFKTKRFLSGLLAVVTIAMSAIQPVPAFTAEDGAEKPTSYEKLKEFLDALYYLSGLQLVLFNALYKIYLPKYTNSLSESSLHVNFRLYFR